MKIGRFDKQYRFLSNFFPVPGGVRLDRDLYPTVEHAYQAAKTLDGYQRAHIRELPTPGAAKREGRVVTLRPDWDAIRLEVMLGLLREKFTERPLRQQLLDTRAVELVEGNDWGDRFWGVCRGEGQNWLGRLLMQVRAELKAADR